MKKTTVAHLYCLILAIGLFSFTGCSLLDLNGDGKVDPVSYLEDADISVGWVDQETGEVYTMAIDELGHKIVGQWVQAKTGYTYELDPNGAISIIDPEGQVFTVSPKAPDNTEEE